MCAENTCRPDSSLADLYNLETHSWRSAPLVLLPGLVHHASQGLLLPAVLGATVPKPDVPPAGQVMLVGSRTRSVGLLANKAHSRAQLNPMNCPQGTLCMRGPQLGADNP